MRCIMSMTFVAGLLLGSFGCTSSTEYADNQAAVAPRTISNDSVEAACASCIYEMEGVEDCELAVKIDGKPYLVSGVDLDAHESGLCEAPKQAIISGKVEDDQFTATSFEFEQ